MKKILGGVFVAVFLASGFVAEAQEEFVGGGFEASGHILAGGGWQRFTTKGGSAAVGTAVLNDVNGTMPGVIGAYADTNGNVAGINREDVHIFFLDEAELDLAKSFGMHIRLRADLDFGASTLYSGPRFSALGVNLLVEQAFATANIPVGNGFEVLLGRFNAPMGFEKNDVIDNDTISRSVIYRALRPTSLTGLRIYHPSTRSFSWQVWGANNGLVLDNGDRNHALTDVPSAGARLNFQWGEEGRENHVGLSGAWGKESANATAAIGSNMKRGWSLIGDLDFNWWLCERFRFGGEGIYHQINSLNGGEINAKYVGALGNFYYDLSDTLGAAFRYSFGHDVNGPGSPGARVLNITNAAQVPLGTAIQSLTGGDQSMHEFALAANYAITERAGLRLEGGYTWIIPQLARDEHVVGFAGSLGYSF